MYISFIKYSEILENEFWKSIFEDLAKGQCPYGLYIQKDHLCCSIKNKEFAILINDESIDFAKKIHKILRRIGIQSPEEKETHVQKILKNNQLKNPKKRILRESVLEQFVLKKSKKYLLSKNVTNKLFSILLIGFIFKVFSQKDFIMNSDDSIKNIQGIIFLKKRVIITKNIFQYGKSFNNNFDYNNNKISFSTIWSSFLQDFHSL